MTHETSTSFSISDDGVVPPGMLGFYSANRQALVNFTKTVGIPPHVTYRAEEKYFFFIKVDGLPEINADRLPDAIALAVPGNIVPITDKITFNSDADIHAAQTVALAIQGAADESETILSRYSVRGRSDEFLKRAVKTVPLLGNIVMKGQATVIYAAPNTGKTLISLALINEAVSSGRIMGNRVFYVNADDSSSGVAEKMALTDDMGVEMLIPHENGFDPESLAEILEASASNGEASGMVVIIDTIKKCTSLMEKKAASKFSKSCRIFIMSGGTIIALAHVNKKPGSDGKPIYSGTSDIVDDFDAAYTLAEARPVEGDDRSNMKYVRFENIKRRGDNDLQSAYAYSTQQGLSYAALVASVTEVEADKLDWWDADQDATESKMIEAVKAAIKSGVVKKMEIARMAAAMAGCGRAKLVTLLDNMNGKLWDYSVRERGAKVYHLLEPAAT